MERQGRERREHDEEVREDVAPRRADYAPEGVERRSGLWPTLKRTATEFQEDNLSDWAAALTYYGLLSLFPALIALVSVLGLFGDPQTTTTADHRHRHPDRTRVGRRDVLGPDRVDHLEPGRRRDPVLRRLGGRALVGIGLRGGVYPGVQRRLGNAGGATVLQAPAIADPDHAGDGDHARSGRALRSFSPARSSRRSGTQSASATRRCRSGTSPSGRCCSRSWC